MSVIENNTLRSWAAIIVAITGLVTAIGVNRKSDGNHSVAKLSYEEMSNALTHCLDQTDQNHDDIVALRAYVAASSSAPSPPPSSADAGVPAPLPTVHVHPTPPHTPRPALTSPPAATAAPPLPHEPKPRYDLPNFDQIDAKVKR